MVSSLDAAFPRNSPGRQKMSGLVSCCQCTATSHRVALWEAKMLRALQTPRTQERKRKSIPPQRSIVREAVLAAVHAGKTSGACKNPAGREGIRCRIKGLSESSHCHEDTVDLALKNLAGPDPAPASRLHSASVKNISPAPSSTFIPVSGLRDMSLGFQLDRWGKRTPEDNTSFSGWYEMGLPAHFLPLGSLLPLPLGEERWEVVTHCSHRASDLLVLCWWMQ